MYFKNGSAVFQLKKDQPEQIQPALKLKFVFSFCERSFCFHPGESVTLIESLQKERTVCNLLSNQSVFAFA